MKTGDIIRRMREAAFKRDKSSLKWVAVELSIIVLAVVLASGIVAYNRKTVSIVIDGEKRDVMTYCIRYYELLNKEGIFLEPEDKADRDLNAKIMRHDAIAIKKAVNTVVNVDEQQHKIKSAENDVAALLAAHEIALRPGDRVLPSLYEKITDGIVVDVIRVDDGTVTETEAIDFQSVVRNDGNLLATQSRILQEGRNGEKQISYRVIYENGKEVSREIIQEIIQKHPVNEIVIKGSLPVFSVSRGDFRKEIVVKATAYYALYGIGRTYTYSGRKAVRDPYGFSTIAVDPSVIPIGTKVYVEGYGYAIAADTGEAVKGNFIDVYFDTYREAANWGVKYLKVYILN